MEHDKDTISIIWHVDDVREIRPELSDDQLRKVLHAVKKNHDASFGVTWDTLELWGHNLYPVDKEHKWDAGVSKEEV